jgi:hypothetical protein
MSERIARLEEAVETSRDAWSYMDEGEPQYVMGLEIPPVDSAETAVKIAIATHGK